MVTKGTTLKQDSMIKALKANMGVVSTSCELVGISRKTHYQWLRENPKYKEMVDEVNEAMIDFVESKLLEKINGILIEGQADKKTGEKKVYFQGPSDLAITFFLKTKGKKRGYVEKTEIENTHKGEGVQIVINRKNEK